MMNKHDIVRFGQTTLIALCVQEIVRRTDYFPNRATTKRENRELDGQRERKEEGTSVANSCRDVGRDSGPVSQWSGPGAMT